MSPQPTPTPTPGAGRLAGRVALVTGGAHGLGQAIVRAFVAEGAQVVVADVDDAAAGALAAELGPAARPEHLDVGSEAQWTEVVDRTVAELGGLHVGVNNAGVVHKATLAELTLADYEATVRVNQVGTFLGMRTMAEPMKAAGAGSIVNISSVRGLVGRAGLMAYTATKFAVRGMTKVAALELGEFGIRVNSIHPGAVATRLIGSAAPEDVDPHFAHQPIGRIARPAEIARLAVFLASDDSSYSTGSEFVADGGVSAGDPG